MDCRCIASRLGIPKYPNGYWQAVSSAIYGEAMLRWWLHTDLGIGRSLLWAIAAWVLAQALFRVPNLLLNGLSVLRYQIVIVSVTTGLRRIALKFALAHYFGVAGILWGTTATILLILIPACLWRIWRWAMRPLPRAAELRQNRAEEILGNL